jgi:glutamine synthetase
LLSLDELRDDHSIDTVIMAFTDMQGRLLGKRLHRDFFF